MEQKLIDVMRLIKIIKENEYELSNKHNSTDRGMFTVGIQQAIDELPTIDPVYAAGACYCRECKHWKADPDECFTRDSNGVKIPLGSCDLSRRWHKENHFVPTEKGNKMKYWISDWATDQGIIGIEAEPIDKISALESMNMQFVETKEIKFIKITKTQHNGLYPLGDCIPITAGIHETKAAARSAAEEMRTKKIASLRKQIERLETLKF